MPLADDQFACAFGKHGSRSVNKSVIFLPVTKRTSSADGVGGDKQEALFSSEGKAREFARHSQW